MSIAEDCAIMRQIQAENRRKLYARIDRQLAKRQDALGDLYRRGVDVASANRQERAEHRLTVERYRDALRPYLHWRPVCSCGWTGRGTVNRDGAEDRARDERDSLYRPLSATLRHSVSAA